MTSSRQPPAAKKTPKVTSGYRPTITATMNVMDAIALHPGAGDVLGEYGLHCFQCAFNTMDSIEAGARSHGLTDTDIENIVTDLQDLIDDACPKPQTITLTRPATEALLGVAKQENKSSAVLRVASDDQSGFCLEFDSLKPSDLQFTCPGIENVSVVASPDILWRAGGSTIDFREGRFKLDLAADDACACGGSCDCGTNTSGKCKVESGK